MSGPAKTPHPLYAVRLWQQHKQLIFPIYTAIVNALGAKAGDLVLVRVHLPYVTFRIANPDLTLPTPHFAPDELPPTYRGLLAMIQESLR